MNESMRDGLVKRGATWSYVVTTRDDVTDKPRRQWTGGFATRTAAREARDDARDRLNKGGLLASSQKLGLYLDEWLKGLGKDLKPSTVASYRMHVRVYLTPDLGELPLRKLTPARLRAYFGRLADDGGGKGGKGGGNLAPATVDRIRATLRSALTDAVGDGLLMTNPAAARRRRGPRKQRPETEAPKLSVWTPEQLATFLELSTGGRQAALWRLAAMTGMRRAELAGLRWKDAKLEAGVARIEVRHTLTAVYAEKVEGAPKAARGTAVRLVAGAPKSRRGHRVIDLDDATAAVLRAHRARQKLEQRAWGGKEANKLRRQAHELREKLSADDCSAAAADDLARQATELDALADRIEADWNPLGLAFVREDGQAIHPDALSRAFRRLLTAAPLDDKGKTTLPTIRLHDLRHTHASHLLAAGVQVHIVAQRLGHEDPGFTMRTYAHLLPRQQRDAAELAAGLVATSLGSV